MVRFGRQPCLEQRADAVDGFEHGGGAAVGIDGAVDPGIAMIADDDPLVGRLGALDFADDVPDGAALVVLLRRRDGRGRRRDRCGSGRAARPASLRGRRAVERLQDGRGVVIAERDGENVGLVALRARRARSRAGQAWRRRRGFAGSPGYLKRYWTEPRWTPVAGRQGPSG